MALMSRREPLLVNDHPAWIAYYSGALYDSIALTHLLKGRPDLVKRLIDAYVGHSKRICARTGDGYRPRCR